MLCTQMSSATKTDEMLKAGIIDGELTFTNARSLQGSSNITVGMKVHPCLQLLKLRPLRRSTSPRRRASSELQISHHLVVMPRPKKHPLPSVALEDEMEGLRIGEEDAERIRAALAAQKENVAPKVRIVPTQPDRTSRC